MHDNECLKFNMYERRNTMKRAHIEKKIFFYPCEFLTIIKNNNKYLDNNHCQDTYWGSTAKRDYSEWPNGFSYLWNGFFTKHKHIINVFIFIQKTYEFIFYSNGTKQDDLQLLILKYVYGEIEKQRLMPKIGANLKLVLTAIKCISTIS